MQSSPLAGAGLASAPLLSPRHVADVLGVSLPTVYRLVDRRAIAVVRVGRSLRFSPADINRYLESRREGVIAES